MDFNSVLNTKMDDIERPLNVPVGTYRFTVKKAPSLEKSKDDKWEFLTFQLLLLEAVDGVEPEDLAAYGGLNAGSIVQHKFIFDLSDEAQFKKTMFNVKRFLVDHLKCATEETSLKEGVNASINAQGLVFVKWEPDKNDPEIQYARAGRTAPLE